MAVGGSPKEQAEARKKALSDAMKHELSEWGKLDMSPANITVDGFHLEVRFNTVVTYLINKGLIDEDELMIELQERLLKTMAEIRIANTPAARKQQIVQGIRPGIIGPNGEVLH